jgi:hypothetical protein
VPAASPGEITPYRPFYPASPRGARREHLAAGLGVAHHDDLLRRCERPGALVRRPSSLFWLVGPNQVGRAAIAGWLQLLVPALREVDAGAVPPVWLWPFDGSFAQLVGRAGTVVAETYPAQCAAAVGVWPVVKSRAEARREAAGAVVRAADRLGVTLTAAARADVARGFPNEHAFDAFVGLLGLVAAARGVWPADVPADVPALAGDGLGVEGWILGAGRPAGHPAGDRGRGVSS